MWACKRYAKKCINLLQNSQNRTKFHVGYIGGPPVEWTCVARPGHHGTWKILCLDSNTIPIIEISVAFIGKSAKAETEDAFLLCQEG